MLPNKCSCFSIIPLLLLAVLPVSAGISRPLPPEDLERHAAVIVEGMVNTVRNGLDESTGRISRYIEIDVSRVYRGPKDLEHVTLREAGGAWGDWIHHVTGVPIYNVGEHVLTFLEPGPDGSLRTVGMHLGLFQIEQVDKRQERHALREVSGEGTFPHSRMDLRHETWKWSELRPTLRRARKRDSALDWLARPSEIHRVRWDPGPSRVAPTGTSTGSISTLQQITDQSYSPTFAPLNTDTPARWSAAADGQTLRFDIDRSNTPILPATTTITEIERAMLAWTDIPESRLSVGTGNTALKYVDSGYGSPASEYSGINVILFDDPYNDISDPVQCSGVLGIGGYWAYSGPIQTVNGLDFRPIAQSYVIFANGFGCLLQNSDNVAELAMHELGHALGFGHSTVYDAAMRSSFYGNRGPRPGDDDADVAQCHYPHAYQWSVPGGTESLKQGELLHLQWTRSLESGPDESIVNLEYRENNLSGWILIATDTSDDGSFHWTLPSIDSADVQMRVRRPHRTSFGAPYPEACSASISDPFEVRPAAVPIAGEVPAGVSAPPLMLSRGSENSLTLDWAASCTGMATGYAVYSGSIDSLRAGSFAPSPVNCMVGNDLTETFDPAAGNRYFLVAPLAGTSEGGFGSDSSGQLRAVPAVACAPREATTTKCP